MKNKKVRIELPDGGFETKTFEEIEKKFRMLGKQDGWIEHWMARLKTKGVAYSRAKTGEKTYEVNKYTLI